MKAHHLIADRGYDTNTILHIAAERGMEAVIPPKRNRTQQRSYDRFLYKLRHLIENALLYLKAWRGIATRYAKTSDSYLAAVNARCLFKWLSIS